MLYEAYPNRKEEKLPAPQLIFHSTSFPMSSQENNSQEALLWLDRTAQLLDNRFRIPGTHIRFGIDSIVGLVPYVGDVITFFISGFLVIAMVRFGAHGKALFKMIGNIWIDGMVGTIPLLGDIFDFRYRANLRNVDLMREHFSEGKHRGSAWPIIMGIVFLLLLMVVLSIYVVYRVFYWIIT